MAPNRFHPGITPGWGAERPPRSFVRSSACAIRPASARLVSTETHQPTLPCWRCFLRWDIDHRPWSTHRRTTRFRMSSVLILDLNGATAIRARRKSRLSAASWVSATGSNAGRASVRSGLGRTAVRGAISRERILVLTLSLSLCKASSSQGRNQAGWVNDCSNC
jgi:hypothetical protein